MIHLIESNVVCIKGSLNFREDEEPKLICDTIDLARTDGECEQSGYSTSDTPQKGTNPQTPARKEPPKLYLKIDDLNTDLYRRAKRVTDIFDGRTPVVFYLANRKKQVMTPANMWVSLNDVMIRELKYQLGEKNVVVK